MEVVVSYLMLARHLRSTGTLLPCSDSDGAETWNSIELDAVCVQHAVLLVARPLRMASIVKNGSVVRTTLRHDRDWRAIRQPLVLVRYM
jgi:hypothetical protein